MATLSHVERRRFLQIVDGEIAHELHLYEGAKRSLTFSLTAIAAILVYGASSAKNLAENCALTDCTNLAAIVGILLLLGILGYNTVVFAWTFWNFARNVEFTPSGVFVDPGPTWYWHGTTFLPVALMAYLGFIGAVSIDVAFWYLLALATLLVMTFLRRIVPDGRTYEQWASKDACPIFVQQPGPSYYWWRVGNYWVYLSGAAMLVVLLYQAYFMIDMASRPVLAKAFEDLADVTLLALLLSMGSALAMGNYASRQLLKLDSHRLVFFRAIRQLVIDGNETRHLATIMTYVAHRRGIEHDYSVYLAEKDGTGSPQGFMEQLMKDRYCGIMPASWAVREPPEVWKSSD